MASMTTTMFKFPASVIHEVGLPRRVFNNVHTIVNIEDIKLSYAIRFPCPAKKLIRDVSFSVKAVGSGLEGSITDTKGNGLNLKEVRVVVESCDDDRMLLRIDLSAESTQKAYDSVLSNLARTAPPIPGFRKMKGGKTSNVPKSFLLQILGRDRVTKFTIQEIVSSATADYVKKENLNVVNKFITTQSEEELEASFVPGQEFGFNASIEFDKSVIDATA